MSNKISPKQKNVRRKSKKSFGILRESKYTEALTANGGRIIPLPLLRACPSCDIRSERRRCPQERQGEVPSSLLRLRL